jgi:hypothetical protein
MFTFWTDDRRRKADLVASPDMPLVIRVRLLELMLSKDDRVAIQAAELLGAGNAIGGDYANQFVGVSTEALQEARKRANDYISQLDREDGSIPHEQRTGKADTA